MPKFLQNSRKETRAVRCNNIGRTGIWKWLDTVFQGQCLPSFSINYVCRHKQTYEKLPPHCVLDKDKNLSWSGLHWHRSCHCNEMTLLPIILAAFFLTGKSFSGAFCSMANSRLDVREVKTEAVWALSRIFWDKVFMVRNKLKKGKFGCWAVQTVENEALLAYNFTS